jgi:hypothetical protein
MFVPNPSLRGRFDRSNLYLIKECLLIIPHLMRNPEFPEKSFLRPCSLAAKFFIFD